MKKKLISLVLLLALCLPSALYLVGCGGGGTAQKDTLVIMTENLDGLFNPFFSTSAPDGTIVSMTQIGMLTSKLNDNKDVDVAFGQDEATATLDYASKYDEIRDKTVYTFVLKNGIKFSDGHPLTMEDVLFNLYVYLDPVYTGSATIYSTEIEGLAAYRNQTSTADGDTTVEDEDNKKAATLANYRLSTLITLYQNTSKAINGPTASGFSVTEAQMIEAIGKYNIKNNLNYLSAVAVPSEQNKVTNEYLLNDYKLALQYFREELDSDFINAKDSYTEEPYKSHPEFANEVFCFMFMEGFIDPVYAKQPGTNKDDLTKIESFTYKYDQDTITTKEQAIEKVYEDTVTMRLNQILSGWATSTKLLTEYTAKAKEVILLSRKKDGELIVPNISGILSLGHSTDVSSVTVNGNTYTVAKEHNADGTPKNENEYDVLQITINGVDPKAVWNFSFSVAPQHYYGDNTLSPMDIAHNKFGVEYASFDYMRNVLQTPDKNRLPMGAGAYKATNRENSDTPSRADFFSNNLVYFKANDQFETVGTGLSNAKISKIRYQVVSASNALAALEEGGVDYITPQYSKENYQKINALTNSGKFDSRVTDQLGYGYIGINASKVTDINIRKAIMMAMNTTKALDYYATGTASQIYWPMSKVSWAYPDGESDHITNQKEYPQAGGTFNKDYAIERIQYYMDKAGFKANDSRFTLTFTIAGSNVSDHPCYSVFRDAADLLNDLGWKVTVEPDALALTKLSTGSLTVWAAAWGSSLDPDMYQVYHKNSTATSTKAWGYGYLKTSGTPEEQKILNDLADAIDAARDTEDRGIRSERYKEAMGYVLDLAIELPVYQRSSVYVYNKDVLDPATLPDEINPYSSPLDRIWELDFKK